MKLLTGIASILIILTLIAMTCNNPVEEIKNNNGGNGHNDSCGFG